MDNLKVEANDVIAEYREKNSQLEFDNTVLRLQVKKLQNKIDELTAPKKNDVKKANKQEVTYYDNEHLSQSTQL